MRYKEPSFIRLAAIGTWRCFNPEARAAAKAKDAEEERRIESFHRELQKIGGANRTFKIIRNGGFLEAVVGDLRFVAYEMTSPETGEIVTLLTLLGRCPSCGVETLSEPIPDMTWLGKILDKFEPIHWHYCLTLIKDLGSKNS